MTKADLFAMLDKFDSSTPIITPRGVAPSVRFVTLEDGSSAIMVAGDPKDLHRPVLRPKWMARLWR